MYNILNVLSWLVKNIILYLEIISNVYNKRLSAENIYLRTTKKLINACVLLFSIYTLDNIYKSTYILEKKRKVYNFPTEKS